MKASANISTLVYVIQNVSEDDFYTYTDFISYFAYDENKFNNADERDIKNLKRLDKFLERADDDFELYKERGDLRAELGLYEAAIDDYKKALELNSNYKEAKQALKKTENDLDIYNFINSNSLIENDSGKDSGYYFDKAYKFYDERKYKESIVYYSKTIELDNNNSAAYNNRGLAKNNLGQYQEALKDCNKAIELDPNYSNAYNGRGNAKYGLGQYEEAIKDYDKAIELDINFSMAYNNRGLAKNNLCQYEEAIKDYDKAIEIDPNYRNAYNNRGVSKENLEEYNEALKDYKKALELDPNYDIARENIKEIQDKYGLK
ncbi:tetratricopeptide repeat protein [Brachyspira pulli]|uniref:tetratricopeptide repeat protein n=1 Tax=Brachyspira pulli TaxID=310721 RepID=UPI00300706A3